MKFSSIEDFDHFPDATIFWIDISEPPHSLKSRAMLIDGKNYNETCFGMCVIFDAQKQEFDVVTDQVAANEEPCTVYYVDDNGDKHWIACELPEEVTKQIFFECQQVLDFKKVEHGYEIKESIQFEDGSGFIVAENPASEKPFLTAHFTAADRGQRYYVKQKFHHHWKDAIEDFTKRAKHRKQFLSVIPGKPQAGGHQKNTEQAKGRTNRPKHKRR